MTYREDWDLLWRHTDAFELTNQDGGRLAVAPQFQARIMTSSFGLDAPGHGWINHELIASGKQAPHMNAVGGEERFWMGPEGGQFSIFFKEGDSFDLDHWQVPAFIDSTPWRVIHRSESDTICVYRGSVQNFSGTRFEVGIRRHLQILGRGDAAERLGCAIPESITVVGHESVNQATNEGSNAWTREGGLLSIWVLSMMQHSPKCTVVLPFVEGSEADLGPVVNDAYFGKVPEDRLAIRNGLILFKADGQHRSKIGVTPQRAKPVMGSWDPSRSLLTLAIYSLPQPPQSYVNSMWEMQDDPYAGDAINSYNDGPPEPGKAPFGPFYELESSSPALALKPGESAEHRHATLHLTGEVGELEKIAKTVLGASLSDLSL